MKNYTCYAFGSIHVSWRILYASLEAIYYGLLITMGLLMHIGGREYNVGVLLCRLRLGLHAEVSDLQNTIRYQTKTFGHDECCAII